MFKSSSVFFTDRSFVDPFFYLCFMSAMLTCLFIVALWPLAGKGLTLTLLYVIFSCVFVTFPCGVPGKVWYLIVSITGLCLLPYFKGQG